MIEFYQDGTKLTVGEESITLIQSIVEEDPEQVTPAEHGGHRSKESIRTDGQSRQCPNLIGGQGISWLIHATKDVLLKQDSVNFVKVSKIKGNALVEPCNIEEHIRALPAVYRDSDRITIINLSIPTIVKKGQQIATVRMLTRDQIKPEIQSIDTASKKGIEKLIKSLKIDENKLLKEHPHIQAQV